MERQKHPAKKCPDANLIAGNEVVEIIDWRWGDSHLASPASFEPRHGIADSRRNPKTDVSESDRCFGHEAKQRASEPHFQF